MNIEWKYDPNKEFWGLYIDNQFYGYFDKYEMDKTKSIINAIRK